MRFRDRLQAGRTLSVDLDAYARTDAVVVGLAGGGVPVGRSVADALRLPLDVISVLEFFAPAPHDAEEIGAVAAYGRPVLLDDVLRRLLLPPDYLDQTVHEHRLIAEAHEDAIRDRALRKPLTGRPVLLVGDGACPELYWRAALKRLRAEDPAEVVAAAPVLCAAMAEALKPLVDRVEALERVALNREVAGHYERFPVVQDEEMRDLIVHQVSG